MSCSINYTYVYTIYELKRHLSIRDTDFLIAPACTHALRSIIKLIKQYNLRLIIIDVDPDMRQHSIFSKGLCASMHEAIPFEKETNY